MKNINDVTQKNDKRKSKKKITEENDEKWKAEEKNQNDEAKYQKKNDTKWEKMGKRKRIEFLPHRSMSIEHEVYIRGENL